jgi:hypothetical protein
VCVILKTLHIWENILKNSLKPAVVVYVPEIPALWRLKQEDGKFKANLGDPVSKNKQKKSP